MTDINQNFSLHAGNDTEVFFDLGPDENGLNLEFVQALTWDAYRQVQGVRESAAPIISKAVGSGIEVTDPLLMQFTITLAGEDSAELAGNYYHEVRIVADHGEVTTAATGLMTVINPVIAPNVVAFKSIFPDFADVDDTLVQIALDAAGRFVDDTWGTSQVAATMFLSAHFLSMASTTSDTSGQIITSESIGRISVSYASAQTDSSGGGGTLGMSSYGTIFQTMLTAQGYGVAII
jgi:Protein of unknown function (DUF4054)